MSATASTSTVSRSEGSIVHIAIGHIGRVWRWLTEPAVSIQQPEHRRRARLLSSMLATIIPLILIISLVQPGLANPSVSSPFQTPLPYVALGAVLILGGAYALSRTQHYELGAILTVSVFALATFALILAEPSAYAIQSLMVYLSAAILLTSILLPLQTMVVMTTLNFAAALMFPLLIPIVPYGTILNPLIFDIVMAVIIILSASIRQRDLAQIERQSNELAEAVRQSQAANKLKDHFLANMSHELRTPLNAIIGFAEVSMMGLAGKMDPQVERSIQRIHYNSERLLQLIEDVLDISKIEAGRVEILPRPFDPIELLNTVEMTIRPQIAKKDELALVTEIDPALPRRMIGDAKRLEQILLNLTSNAIKFTEKGSVTVELKRLNEQEWAILVSDTGIGIPSHAQETIFEKFRQIDGSSRRAYSGTGLGLAIARELALLMNGNVKVKSTTGKGSTFTVTLPLLVPEIPGGT